MHDVLKVSDLLAKRSRVRSLDELTAELPEFLASPCDQGTLTGISVRPEHGKRKTSSSLHLSSASGAAGDLWKTGAWLKTDEGQPHPGIQITLINTRFIDFIAGEPDHWLLSGDNLAIDMNLSERNLPVGQRLIVGGAELEVSNVWHGPCDKFRDRFGRDAVQLCAGSKWRHHRLRGVHATVIKNGVVAIGDDIRKAD